MGVMDKDRLCKTCMGSQVDCPGHFGHIKLAKPVYHGNLLDYIRKVLRIVCCKCSHLLSDVPLNPARTKEEGGEDEGPTEPELLKELKAKAAIRNTKSRFNNVFKLTQTLKACPKCKSINHKYKKGALRIGYEIQDPSIMDEMPTKDPK